MKLEFQLKLIFYTQILLKNPTTKNVSAFSLSH